MPRFISELFGRALARFVHRQSCAKQGVALLAIGWLMCVPASAIGVDQLRAETAAIRFVFPGAFSSMELRKRYLLLLDRLSRPSGVAPILTEEPAGRAAISLQQGLQDVDVSRVVDFDRVVPGATKLEPSVVSVKYYVVRRQADALPSSWGDLRSQSVAFMRDVRAIVANLPSEVTQMPIATREACVRLVALGRADSCVLHLSSLAQVPDKAEGVALHSRLVDVQPLFMWVGPGKAELANQLQAVLKRLAESGELDAIMQDAR